MADTDTSIENGGIPEISMSVQASENVWAAVDKTLTIAEAPAEAKAVGDRFDIVEGDVADLGGDIAAIQQWTGEDIPLNTQQSAPKISKAVSDLGEAVAGIQEWTGEDIPVNSEQGAQTIAEVIADITGDAYPVGSVYTTIKSTPPMFKGTWIEIAITATWNQLKTGKRDYAALGEEEQGGAIHFWLRTA